jgi:RNA polymerase sigma-70 factor (ECF subfamily)
MRAALDGDEAAYRQLLQSLSGTLRTSVRSRFARMGCGDIEVEDVVQETLLAIHLKRHTWNRTEKLGPWIAAIARNKLVDVLRRRGRRAEQPIDDVIDTLVDETAVVDDDQRDVAQLLSQLGERQQRIVRCISIEGRSVREAAEQLQMTEVAVRVALHRSLKALASLYRTVTQ